MLSICRLSYCSRLVVTGRECQARRIHGAVCCVVVMRRLAHEARLRRGITANENHTCQLLHMFITKIHVLYMDGCSCTENCLLGDDGLCFTDFRRIGSSGRKTKVCQRGPIISASIKRSQQRPAGRKVLRKIVYLGDPPRFRF